jgi:hypothetical protein
MVGDPLSNPCCRIDINNVVIDDNSIDVIGNISTAITFVFLIKAEAALCGHFKADLK